MLFKHVLSMPLSTKVLYFLIYFDSIPFVRGSYCTRGFSYDISVALPVIFVNGLSCHFYFSFGVPGTLDSLLVSAVCL